MNVILAWGVALLGLYSLVATVILVITMNEWRAKMSDIEDAVRVQNMALDELRLRR